MTDISARVSLVASRELAGGWQLSVDVSCIVVGNWWVAHLKALTTLIKVAVSPSSNTMFGLWLKKFFSEH